MSVAVYIHKASEADSLVSWGIRFARADCTTLLIVVPRREKQDEATFDTLELSERGDSELSEAVFASIERHPLDHVVLKEKIANGVASSDHDRVLIDTRELIASSPDRAFAQSVPKLDIRTLILPATEEISVSSNKSRPEDKHWAQILYETAPCETFMVRGSPADSGMRVLVACSKDKDTHVALNRAIKLTQADSESVEFLYVRADDDEVAGQVAEMHAKNVLARASSNAKKITPTIVLNDSLFEAINAANPQQYDLVLIGTRSAKTMRRLFRHKFPDGKRTEADPARTAPPIAVATIRPSIPLSNRLHRSMLEVIRSIVPQLEKQQRVLLVDRLQEGSSFNFDFVSLISLSTIIAALGLLDDSAAVVIGAMLVAPLMTPLVGIGFALVQGNLKLMKTGIKSVIAGFAVAFCIGLAVGLLAQWFTDHPISVQMAQRDSPSHLDLLVALFSGVAGAYAMSRANLISALPGVAIAAALIPPLATAGMAFPMGDFTLGGGALLLFFTNIVAIILGTAVSFWFVGINTRLIKSKDGTQTRPPRMWPRYWFVGLVILSILLATEMQMYQPLKKRMKNIQPAPPGAVEPPVAVEGADR